MDAIDALTSRYSARAFTKQPVDRKILQQILTAASRSPSGVNTQPWLVHVVSGDSKEKISQAMLAERAQDTPAQLDYIYYPTQWFEPYIGRRKACGAALYGALDIEYGNKEKRLEQWNKNYSFFGAPIGLFFFIHANMQQGSWMDLGMFLQSIMIAARGFGLHTCPQAAMAEYPNIIRQQLEVSDEYHLACGMALGYADESNPVNQYRTEREAVETFTTWHD